MGKKEFENLMNQLMFTSDEIIYLVRNGMEPDIREYTPTEIMWVKKQVEKEKRLKELDNRKPRKKKSISQN